jgi:hypothetical protein
LRIAHDFFPQRSASGCDDLNHRLHYRRRFSRKSLPLQCFFRRQAMHLSGNCSNRCNTIPLFKCRTIRHNSLPFVRLSSRRR